MKITSCFSGNFLKAADLDGPAVVTIAGVEMVDLKDDGEKPALSFQGTEQKMVLNKTNANNIVEFLGAETDDWIGQKVEVYPSTTDFQGKTVACLRIREPQAKKEIVSDESPF